MIQEESKKEQRREQRARGKLASNSKLHHSAPAPSVCSSFVVCLQRDSVFAMCFNCVSRVLQRAAVCLQSASQSVLHYVCSVFAVCLQCVYGVFAVCLQCVTGFVQCGCSAF